MIGNAYYVRISSGRHGDARKGRGGGVRGCSRER